MIPHYAVDGDGPPLLLLNSLGTTLDMWRPQITPLGARFCLVRFDARGHGGTPFASGGDSGRARRGGDGHGHAGGDSTGDDATDDRGPGRLTIDDLAGDAIDLLDHLGIERAHVAGVSLGGAVAMRLAVTRPERVDRLVLVSTAAKLGTPEGWRERADIVRANGTAAISEAAMGRWFSPAFISGHPDTVAEFRRRFDACDDDGYAACCEALGAMDQRDDVHRITAPALIVGGTADEVTTPADAAFLDERIPDSRMLLAEGAKHLPTAERPDRCNRLLTEFLEEDHDDD
ncbi:3-oxoadipate enol-lactonase [Glycomyces sambucus]|uniref:3-oxoadipate enol-lactonase n=1 Tax=Glycomyces sambucus TaxID=380244 RepID=A0A1G9LUW9_9ACTN|nr:alpha/beta fold hydrolase [Glycomyces sambucus]SDL65746.1 3-oxoadipate enol-lactonase [Glycomyces sambucus]